MKDSYKLILSLLMGMIKYSQSTQSNKFAISLQYLKKEFRNGIHFLHADEHQSCYKLALLFLMEVTGHVQSTQIRKLVLFLQYIKKNFLQWFCVLLRCKTFRYFMGAHSFLLLLNLKSRLIVFLQYLSLKYLYINFSFFL